MKPLPLEGFFLEPLPENEPPPLVLPPEPPDEPCYGHCDMCERSGELWAEGNAWLCWRCVAPEAPTPRGGA